MASEAKQSSLRTTNGIASEQRFTDGFSKG
jgi:hypothetical protein